LESGLVISALVYSRDCDISGGHMYLHVSLLSRNNRDA
jgi:hypothetical protein